MKYITDKMISVLIEAQIIECELAKQKNAAVALDKMKNILLKNLIEAEAPIQNEIKEEPANSEPSTHEEEQAKRTSKVEAIMLGSQIGKEVYRCGWCNEKVGFQDRFCRRCGKRVL